MNKIFLKEDVVKPYQLKDLLLDLGKKKEVYGLTWADVSDAIQDSLGVSLTPEACRKRYARMVNGYSEDDSVDEDFATRSNIDNEDDSFDDIVDIYMDSYIQNMKLERVKLQDERAALSRLIRKKSREDTLIEMAREASSIIAQSSPFSIKEMSLPKASSINEAILQIGDWHYGIEINSAINVYNPEETKVRVNKLYTKVKTIISKNNINVLYLVNLGDLISGRIHTAIRLSNRIDVVTQVIQVTEILANLLEKLSDLCYIEYYDTLDNHSRVEPSKEDAFELESLCRLTSWYLKERLKNNGNVRINENQFSDDIITFNTKGKNGKGYKVAAVHGHKESIKNIVDKLSGLTMTHYDLILLAHNHHFVCDEHNCSVVVGNGSLMGTDQYAHDLRLSSVPSQNLILLSEDSPAECIYRITLD